MYISCIHNQDLPQMVSNLSITYIEDGLAPSSQTIRSLLRTPGWQIQVEKCPEHSFNFTNVCILENIHFVDESTMYIGMYSPTIHQRSCHWIIKTLLGNPLSGIRLWLYLYAEICYIVPNQALKVLAGKPYWRGRISTVDLLVLTSLDQLLFILKLYFSFNTKQPILMRRSIVLSHPLQLGFPGFSVCIF